MVRPNKKITKRNANVMYAPPNTQDNTRGIIPGLTAGTTYGEGQDIKEQVQATGGLPQVNNLQQQPLQPKLNLSQVDAFGPTERPNEPVTAGLPFGSGYSPQQSIEEDPDMMLRVLYNVYPDPIFLQMMNRQDIG